MYIDAMRLVLNSAQVYEKQLIKRCFKAFINVTCINVSLILNNLNKSKHTIVIETRYSLTWSCTPIALVNAFVSIYRSIVLQDMSERSHFLKRELEKMAVERTNLETNILNLSKNINDISASIQSNNCR